MLIRTFALGAVLAVAIGTTLAGASTGSTAHASATGRGLVVGGSRFFPIMAIDQCAPADIARGKALGINLVVNESCPGVAPTGQLALLRRNALAVLPIQARNTRGAGLVGWTYPDEPDNNGWTPASLAKAHPYERGNADGLVTFLTTTGRFFREAPYGSPQVSPAGYAAFARLADMAGFDLYPLNACQSDLTAVYDAQRAFVKLAGPTPTFQWIETGPIRPTYCGGFAMTPDELSAEVWLAVIGGARGIGYFTHTWSPEHRPFDVAPDLQTGDEADQRPARGGDAGSARRDGRVGRRQPGRQGRRAIGRRSHLRVRDQRDAVAQQGGASTSPHSTTGLRPWCEGRTRAAKDHYLIDHFGGTVR